jgi:pseudaminic acid synthase
LKIGNFKLGQGSVFVIAEIGANHGGEISIAKRTIDAAKKAGADAVKLQTYTADTITLNSKKDDFIIKGGTLWDGRKLYDLYEEAHLPWEWHEELFSHARKIGLDIFSSPFDKSAVDFLEKFSPTAYKIASFEITDYELIRYVASKQKPVIISTGVATLQEIQDAVDICRSEGNKNIALLKCTSAYPAPLEDANLKMLPILSESFGVVAGFSDHTQGVVAPIVAVTLGAMIVEKHFVLDKTVESADSAFSMNQHDFKEMVDSIRIAEKVVGRVDFSMSDKKKESRQFCRSLYVSEDIEIGEPFTDKNIRSVRPGFGVHPKYLKNLMGRISNNKYELGDRLGPNEFGEAL